MKVVLNLLALSLLFCQTLNAQDHQPVSNDSLQKNITSLKKDLDILKRLKITGWIQSQLQFADSSGQQSFEGGNFAPNVDKRFMIRRGRVRFGYSNQNSDYVLQINLTERGINLTDLFAKVTDPWTKWVALQAGLFNRPFGFEIQQSSADRETPERSRFTQILMPNERDMGAMLVIEAPKKSTLFGLKIMGGFFNGTGIPSNGDYYTKPFVNDFDVFKDFMGRMSYNKAIKDDKVKFGLGFSHYNGAVRQFNNTIYTKTGRDSSGLLRWFAEDSTKSTLKGKGAQRLYYGCDAQLSLKSIIGTTTLRAECVLGTQPGTSLTTTSPAFEPKSATYIRSFNGYYFYFVQRIMKSKHEIAVKYSVYDPNTKVAGDNIGRAGSGFGTADLKYTELGLGYVNYFNDNIKFMLFYNLVTNETTRSISGYGKDLKDNCFTLRMQVRF